MSEWSYEWPTEPGLYLFYGDFRKESSLRKPSPRLAICKVSLAANGIVSEYDAELHMC